MAQKTLESQPIEGNELDNNVKALLTAIIMNSLKDLFLKAPPGISPGESKSAGKSYRKMVREEAWDWFWNDEYRFGSFLYCCDILDVNVQAIRGELARNKEMVKRRVLLLYKHRHIDS
jgi:hypothetical protein